MSSFKNVIIKIRLQIIYLIYMYKQDLSLNNLQWLIRKLRKQSQSEEVRDEIQLNEISHI